MRLLEVAAYGDLENGFDIEAFHLLKIYTRRFTLGPLKGLPFSQSNFRNEVFDRKLDRDDKCSTAEEKLTVFLP